MREDGKGRFSVKSHPISSLQAAAEVASHSPAQAAQLPRAPQEQFFEGQYERKKLIKLCQSQFKGNNACLSLALEQKLKPTKKQNREIYAYSFMELKKVKADQ